MACFNSDAYFKALACRINFIKTLKCFVRQIKRFFATCLITAQSFRKFNEYCPGLARRNSGSLKLRDGILKVECCGSGGAAQLCFYVGRSWIMWERVQVSFPLGIQLKWIILGALYWPADAIFANCDFVKPKKRYLYNSINIFLWISVCIKTLNRGCDVIKW